MTRMLNGKWLLALVLSRRVVIGALLNGRLMFPLKGKGIQTVWGQGNKSRKTYFFCLKKIKKSGISPTNDAKMDLRYWPQRTGLDKKPCVLCAWVGLLSGGCFRFLCILDLWFHSALIGHTLLYRQNWEWKELGIVTFQIFSLQDVNWIHPLNYSRPPGPMLCVLRRRKEERRDKQVWNRPCSPQSQSGAAVVIVQMKMPL